jgi:Cu/Ag efflux pump CusA
LYSIRHAAKEVARPMTFAVIIIIAVYLPILFLQGLEGRMFRPMAITVCAALAGSLFLALTFVPAMTTLGFAGSVKSDGEPRWIDSIGNLLYLTFNSVKLALLVVGNVPFALVGGIATLWLRHLNLNFSASVGFIVLFGIAIIEWPCAGQLDPFNSPPSELLPEHRPAARLYHALRSSLRA